MKIFTEADLVSFGNFLLSPDRNSTLDEVSHADTENWKELRQEPKI